MSWCWIEVMQVVLYRYMIIIDHFPFFPFSGLKFSCAALISWTVSISMIDMHVSLVFLLLFLVDYFHFCNLVIYVPICLHIPIYFLCILWNVLSDQWRYNVVIFHMTVCWGDATLFLWLSKYIFRLLEHIHHIPWYSVLYRFHRLPCIYGRISHCTEYVTQWSLFAWDTCRSDVMFVDTWYFLRVLLFQNVFLIRCSSWMECRWVDRHDINC